MYDFHHNVTKKKYKKKKLVTINSDTDSFVYAIITQNCFKDLKNELLPYFDTSNFPKNHYCYSEDKKNILGFFKDEM